MSKAYGVSGLSSNVELAKGGPRVKANGTVIESRNSADNAYAIHRGADAVADDDLVTKRQLDSFSAGLKWIDPVDLVETGSDLTLSGEQTIDGVLTSTSRVLLTAQTPASENGVWVTAAGAWTRPTDFPNAGAAANKTMMVEAGGVEADTQWTCTTNSGVDTIDTDALAFSKISSTTAGVTTIADSSGASGTSIIESGTGPTATLYRIEGEAGVISTAVVSGDLVVSIDTGGIGTGKIADDAVTQAKIAPLDAVHTRHVSFDFNDQGGTVNVGAALPANAVVVEASVYISDPFDAATLIDLGTGGVPELLMADTLINAEAQDTYVEDMYVTGAASTQLILTLSAAGATIGDGFCVVRYIVTA